MHRFIQIFEFLEITQWFPKSFSNANVSKYFIWFGNHCYNLEEGSIFLGHYHASINRFLSYLNRPLFFMTFKNTFIIYVWIWNVRFDTHFKRGFNPLGQLFWKHFKIQNLTWVFFYFLSYFFVFISVVFFLNVFLKSSL